MIVGTRGVVLLHEHRKVAGLKLKAVGVEPPAEGRYWMRSSSEGIDAAAVSTLQDTVVDSSHVKRDSCSLQLHVSASPPLPSAIAVNHVFDPGHWTAAMLWLPKLLRQDLPKVGQSHRGRVVGGGGLVMRPCSKMNVARSHHPARCLSPHVLAKAARCRGLRVQRRAARVKRLRSRWYQHAQLCVSGREVCIMLVNRAIRPRPGATRARRVL